jgi:hypothetical protein
MHLNETALFLIASTLLSSKLFSYVKIGKMASHLTNCVDHIYTYTFNIKDAC